MYKLENRSAWLGLLCISFLLIRSEAWLTSEEMAGEPGLRGSYLEIKMWDTARSIAWEYNY